MQARYCMFLLFMSLIMQVDISSILNISFDLSFNVLEQSAKILIV